MSTFSIPEGKYVDIGNVAGHAQRVHYHEQGSGDPVIFLHGAGAGASGYSNFKGNYPDRCSLEGKLSPGASAEALRAGGYAGAIEWFGDEPWGPYHRPPLSKEALRGGIDPAALEFRRKAAVDDVDWRLGTAVAVAPYWHPIKLAGEAAFTDLISGGRLEFGIGSGAYSKKKEEEAVHGVGTGSYSKKDGDAEANGKSIDAGPKKFKTSEAFYRDGARYVCNGCQAKYFTRGEVEACFAKH